MNDAFRTERFTHDGREFEAACYYDEDMGEPWKEHDGHGPIREVRSREDKRPGERLIYRYNTGDYYAYDWQAAMRMARTDWGFKNGKDAEEAVRQDFERMAGWINDKWCWIGVAVRIIGPDGKPEGDEFAHSLWGVESDGDYWKEAARELAGDILRERREAWQAALREARERHYWQSRDVQTV